MYKVAIVIPTCNAGGEFASLLAEIARQSLPIACKLVIDSSSTDGTADVAKKYGWQVRSIPKAEFSHGGTRQMAVELLPDDIEIVVFLTQDVRLPDRYSLEKKVKDFIKLDNGLPDYSIKPICRKNLDITKDAFVFCLVSRGIPEKGWSEAVEAINIVRNKIKRDIQIIIIGDGVMYDAIKARNYKFVHLLGEKQNIRDYYAMCDMGILPTYFPGESYPLVIIDCLKAGIPMLTSNIGEISHQLSTPSGKYAGLMVELRDGKIHLEDLVKAIERVVENKDIYISLCNNVVEAREKFDISNIAQQYIDLYKNNVNIHVGNSVNKDVC